MKALWRRWIAAMEGLSAETIASILVIGLVLGTFPIFGCPTILCALASLVFRLNFPALQLTNQLSWPLQAALLIPCARLGARIFVTPHESTALITWRLGLQAVTGWFCMCVPLGVLLYFALSFGLKAAWGRRSLCVARQFFLGSSAIRRGLDAV